MRVKLHLIAGIDVTPLPEQDPVELARIKLNAMREATQLYTEYGISLYENGTRNPEVFDVEEWSDGVTILRNRKKIQEEIDEHIANDEFQCYQCDSWEDIEDSIEYKGGYYCQECCVKASCGCTVPRKQVIFHDDGSAGTITCCEDCYERVK